MTDTAYLYEYFLNHSTVNKSASPKDINKEKKVSEDKEGKSDGKQPN